MLKFLTHKLRTHSLNEDPNQEKTDDDHDSGTESDDEFQDDTGIADEPSSPMESLESPRLMENLVFSDTDFAAPTPILKDRQKYDDEELESEKKSNQKNIIQTPKTQESQKDLLLYLNCNDQHSSEEELEVINGPKVVNPQRYRTATAREKRKWSEVNCNTSQTQCQSQHQHCEAIVASCSAPVSRTGKDAASGSSDEEVQGLLGSRSGSGNMISQPVQFRTSPPVDAHKPGRSLSPPPKLFHASSTESKPPPRPRSRPRPHSHFHSHLEHHHHLHHHYHHHYTDNDVDVTGTCSPRKRHRPPHRLPRPCLDFEKMQQMKAQAVTTWRHSSEHGKELSVFCW
ncbi:E3 ubiquitin-protein ligase arkadia-like [Leptopilina heterotoma]|uniref:E3 ubiquitin-protein ligase arkadia-like n=1 Tax=Leptopilina heterotoma TaxID=63436 RepID=UPI001CA98B17|nr:E3 ubiquitin-protein ligase arkadia-like [Leptopilina heterotoma]